MVKTQWFKWVFVVIITLTIFTGCNSAVIYDEPVIVIEKSFSDEEQFKYRYVVEIMYKERNTIKATQYTEIAFHTNSNWNIGDTIWMGARWGKNYEQPEEE